MSYANVRQPNFTQPRQLRKALNSLIGLLDGVLIDGVVNQAEQLFLAAWLEQYEDKIHLHPFNEIMPVLHDTLQTGLMDEDQLMDLKWLCTQLNSPQYFSQITADMQKLHALLGGIAADGRITTSELQGLARWLAEHEHLRRCWPYDEVESLVTAVLQDGRIDDAEHHALLAFFGEFIALLDDTCISNPGLEYQGSLQGVCAMDPEIEFANAVFCITGTSSRYARDELKRLLAQRGAKAVDRVTQQVDYLIICANGNSCWAYARYGRKVEEAVKLRKSGHPILLVHEHDVHDRLME